MIPNLLNGEHLWISAVVDELFDDSHKLIYADWLEERGDDRSQFLRSFVHAAQTMNRSDFPRPEGIPEEWLELIGFRLLDRIAAEKALELKNRALRLARPALRMNKILTNDEAIAIGASKIGGLPDLPADFEWPRGGDCHAIYNDDTGGTARLAGFLAQVNFAEIAHSQATKELPKSGVLSFFCFQDIENDNPDAIGARAVFFPKATRLVRKSAPKELTEGNTVIPPHRLTFAETLDLPEAHYGPWSKELNPDERMDYDVLDYFRDLNFYNFLGYARSTTGGDPTPSKRSRHLIVLQNAVECQLHIQLDQDDLAAHRFEAITLDWVDFD